MAKGGVWSREAWGVGFVGSGEGKGEYKVRGREGGVMREAFLQDQKDKSLLPSSLSVPLVFSVSPCLSDAVVCFCSVGLSLPLSCLCL